MFLFLRELLLSKTGVRSQILEHRRHEEPVTRPADAGVPRPRPDADITRATDCGVLVHWPAVQPHFRRPCLCVVPAAAVKPRGAVAAVRSDLESASAASSHPSLPLSPHTQTPHYHKRIPTDCHASPLSCHLAAARRSTGSGRLSGHTMAAKDCVNLRLENRGGLGYFAYVHYNEAL